MNWINFQSKNSKKWFICYSSYLIYRKMRSSANNASLSSSQDRARRRRNQTITLVLIGIIVLFLICHIGEVAISIYELADLLDGERTAFPVWANTIVIVNHLLIVMNSSLNFVIYCKDVVFRWALKRLFLFPMLLVVTCLHKNTDTICQNTIVLLCSVDV